MESLINSWQHLPEHITPYLFSIGTFQLRYYSLMYIVAFVLVYFLVIYRIKNEKYKYTAEDIQDYLVWAMIGVLLGARLGYVLIYNFVYYLQHPLEIFLPFSFADGIRFIGISGMSYHGGVIGVIIMSVLFCRKRKIDFWKFADLICPAIPLGYTFGRLGNFINGELFGRATTMPWGMYFPLDATNTLRHPSQLYEAAFEGILLFIILWLLRKKTGVDGSLLGLYIFGYGLARFIVEFFREPDFAVGLISIGQFLCLLMMLAGIMILTWLKNTKQKNR
ncbi:MAG TPA: prolipoprotein diacylglyceryl transferase [Smithellaceae bacterium]|jgi:phosphatidylglycerol:prolipoprotein diacylglycerol transferase|nr:prolipoprotein diacylglyceryl transferase [Syntrophaceae bacterium]NMD04987.1 prolipoprotein diacylglyceryl transferase [Deltaproteobacteria bacterium]HNQ18701.1 prolipoprotein diacylglyceryl transferase [Smithellaceae bacterium]MBP8607905.1 prolipoprotein diacylglyceryl transferase [Syntrophaceae bacterium]HNT90501.1 prolipoprotein diacylglyceryl transferase [Smithellaceae bacterium]